MRTFLVTFHKIVSDGRGHDRGVLQQQAEAAKAMFCQAASIVDWRLRADTCEVVEIAELAV